MNKSCTRIFVVGCARSGTTFLQAMLSAHTEVISFPESQFFANIVDQYDYRVMGEIGSMRKKILYGYQDILLRTGIAPRPKSGVYAINRFLDKTNIEGEKISLGLQQYLIKVQINYMINLLDQSAKSADKSSWLLKTPSNISYLDIIQQYVEGAKFIHIVRPGKDVVASIVDAAIKHPDTVWKNHFYQNSLSRVAKMWNASVEQTIKYQDDESHMIVSYEKLVAEPQQQISKIFNFLELEDQPDCINKYAEQTADIVSGNEKWKKGVSGDIVKTDKYESLFNAEQKATLDTLLKKVDLQTFI